MNGGPHYPLEEVKELVKCGSREMTIDAHKRALTLGLSRVDVYGIVQTLDAASFQKTMPSKRRPELWQDVYRYQEGNLDLYIKVQVIEQEGGKKANVIDCKPWGGP